MRIVCRDSASMQSHTPFHQMRLREQPTPLDSHQQLHLVATETPISANSRLHTRLLRDDFSGSSASPRPTASSASRPSRAGRLSKTWLRLNRSVRHLCAIQPGHEVSSGTYSTFPKYAKEKTKKKMPNSGSNNFSTTSGHLPIFRRVRHPATTTAVSAYVLCATLHIAIPNTRCSLISAGPLLMGDGGSTPNKAPRLTTPASMESSPGNATPDIIQQPPPPSPAPREHQPHMWGSVMALQGDTDGAILGARVKQFLTSILFTAFVRIMPVDDKVPPMDQRFVRAAIAALLESNLVRDDGISVVHGPISAASSRSPTELSPVKRQTCHQPSMAALRSTSPGISEPGSGTLTRATVYATDIGSARRTKSDESLTSTTTHEPPVIVQFTRRLCPATSPTSELGSGMREACARTLNGLRRPAPYRLPVGPLERHVGSQLLQNVILPVPCSISEPGSGMLSGTTRYASDSGTALGRTLVVPLPAKRLIPQPLTVVLHSIPTSISELGFGTPSGDTVDTSGPGLTEGTKQHHLDRPMSAITAQPKSLTPPRRTIRYFLPVHTSEPEALTPQHSAFSHASELGSGTQDRGISMPGHNFSEAKLSSINTPTLRGTPNPTDPHA